MRIVPSLLVALFLLSLPFGLADVYAQTTTTIITNVSAQFPDHAVTGGTVQVNVTVIYSGASIGQVMIVLIADISNPLIARNVQGVVVSSPDACVPIPAFARNSTCGIILLRNSGTDNLQFTLSAPMSAQDWRVSAGAQIGAYGSDHKTLAPVGSITVFPFTIHVTDTANLRLTLPSSVHAKIDGVDSGQGAIQVSLKVGSHSISIPQIIPIDDNSRQVFNSWSDGVALTDRTITLTSDTTLTAIYFTQYKVTVTSPVTGSTESWQNQGAYVTFSQPSSPQPMAGLGVLGGKWIFDGWYGKGQFLSGSSDTQILISSPLSLEARWHADYTMPIGIMAAIAIAVAALVVFIIKSKSRKKRK